MLWISAEVQLGFEIYGFMECDTVVCFPPKADNVCGAQIANEHKISN